VTTTDADLVLAVDAGTQTTKVAAGRTGTAPDLSSQPNGGRSREDACAAALAEARDAPGGPPDQACVAVPDGWLDGGLSEARAFEGLRHRLEDELGLRSLSWVGQLTAAAALAAWQSPARPPGRYLICDLGGSGVRAALVDVTEQGIRPLAVDTDRTGGWLAFNRQLRAALPDGRPRLDRWFETAEQQQRRAALVLSQATTDPAFRDTPAYRVDGPSAGWDIPAGLLIDSFADVARQLQAAISAVLAGTAPDAALLTGGFGWFPLASQVVTEAAGNMPELLGPHAAALGAHLIARGAVQLAAAQRPEVSCAARQVRNGRLVDLRLPLSPTHSLTRLGEEATVLDSGGVTLVIAGQLRAIPVPELAPGPCRIGLRAAGPGRAILVIRPDEPAGGLPVSITVIDLEP
jgi:hypothetical protein